jgi:hypothetical protein
MNYKYFLYRGCLIFSLLLSSLTYAGIVVDLNQSFRGDFVTDENGIILRDKIKINNILVDTEVKPFPEHPEHVELRLIPFDLVFRACQSDPNNFDTVYLEPLLTGQEPPCLLTVLDFSNSQIFNRLEQGNHWLGIHNVRSYLEVKIEDPFDPNRTEVITTHYNITFEFNYDNLHLEHRWRDIVQPPSKIKILLEWGDNPYDLDVHLTGPAPGLAGTYNNEPDRFHLYFGNKHADISTLHTGEFSDTKPEEITIFPPPGRETLREGIYRFTVHHFSGSGNIVDSGAQVQLWIYNNPDDEPADQLFTPIVDNPLPVIDNNGILISHEENKRGRKEMEMWIVFDLHITDDGMVTVRPIQNYAHGINPSEVRRGNR